MNRKNLAKLLPLLVFALLLSIQSGDTFAASSRNLESDASQWGIYADQGSVTGTISTISTSTPGDKAMQVSLTSGDAYAGLHAYHDLPANAAVQNFSMEISFFFQNDKPIQALEFTMNKWTNNTRYEWALQWQAIASSSTESSQTWRIWTGTAWESLNIHQQLSENSWHTLHLEGIVQNDTVQYQRFLCDRLAVNLSTYQFAPVTSSGNKLAVGMQLDGNYAETPYSVLFKQINLNAR